LPACSKARNDCPGKWAVHYPASQTAQHLAQQPFITGPSPSRRKELELLKRLDERFTENPMFGSRRLQQMLKREGILVGRRRIRRLTEETRAVGRGP
jgi:hypothetical protein